MSVVLRYGLRISSRRSSGSRLVGLRVQHPPAGRWGRQAVNPLVCLRLTNPHAAHTEHTRTPRTTQVEHTFSTHTLRTQHTLNTHTEHTTEHLLNTHYTRAEAPSPPRVSSEIVRGGLSACHLGMSSSAAGTRGRWRRGSAGSRIGQTAPTSGAASP